MKWFNRHPNVRNLLSNSDLENNEPVRPYGNDDHIAHNHLFLYSLVVLFVVFLVPVALVQGAPTTYVQSDWYGQSNITADTPPFTGWNSYLAVDNGILAGSNLQLIEDTRTLTQTSDDGLTDYCDAPGCTMTSGFNGAVLLNNTMVQETGTQAYVSLSTTIANGGYVTPFPAGGGSTFATSNVDTSISNPEMVTAVALDGNHLIFGGIDYAASSGGEWRIEKREKFGGTLIDFGTVVSNQNAYPGHLKALAVDTTSIYAAGYNSLTTLDQQWRLEKRDKVTGALDAVFGGGNGYVESNPLTGDGEEEITAIAVNGTHIFAAGYENTLTGDEAWRIEKYDLDGNPDGAFGSGGVLQINPTTGSGAEKITAIAIDSTYLYVAGYDIVDGDEAWRIEKRLLTDGSPVSGFGTNGVRRNNPSAQTDEIRAMAIDSSSIYLAGFDGNGTSSSEQWRIEKRDISTGSLDTSFNTTGIVTRDHALYTGPEKALALAVDNDHVFAAGYGYDSSSTQTVWQVECIKQSDGTAESGFGTGGSRKATFSGNLARINALAQDTLRLYAGGFSSEGSDQRWRFGSMRTYQYKTSGSFTSGVFDLGSVINNFNTLSWFPTGNPTGTDPLTMEVRAGDVFNTGDASWTTWQNLGSTNPQSLAGLTAIKGKRYLQYRANLSLDGSGNTNVTPRLDTLVLSFSNYATGAALESSVFDTGDNSNYLSGISWSENLNGQEVRMQIATSPDGYTWKHCGRTDANCASNWLTWTNVNNYFDSSNTLLPQSMVDVLNDRYFKYKIYLLSDGTDTPDVDNVSVTYDTAYFNVVEWNGSAESSNFTATAGVPFDIKVKVVDSSGSPYVWHDHSVQLKLVSSVPQYDQGACTSSFTGNNKTEYATGSVSFSSGELVVSGIKICEATTTAFTISAQETAGGSLTSNSDLNITTVNVDAGSLSLFFSPSMTTNTITDQNFSPNPEVEIRDTFGNLATSATNTVTLTAWADNTCSSTASGNLTGTNLTSVSPVNGIATFTNVQYDVAETIYLQASASGIGTPVCSNGINVTSAGYLIKIEPVYDLTNDSIDIIASFLRAGSTVGPGTVTLSSIDVQDTTGTSLLSSALPVVTDTANNVFHATWDPTGGLTPNTLYTIAVTMTYGGTAYNGNQTIQIGQLGEIKQGLTSLDTALTTIDTNVTDTNEIITPSVGTNPGLKQRISDHAASQAAYRAQTTAQLNSIVTEIGAILEDTSNTVPDLIQQVVEKELAKGTISEIITTQSEIKSGATMPFRYRTKHGLKPVVTVYDPKHEAKLASAPMLEMGGTGVYTYNINFRDRWGLGRFMVRVDEPNTEAFDQIVLNVIDANSGEDAAKAAAATSAVSLDTLYSRINKIDSTVTALKSGVDTVKSNTSTVSTDIGGLLDELDKKRTGTTAGTADATEFGKYISSVSSIIGTGSGSSDLRTIMGKLNGIESTLTHMGVEATAASDFNTSAKEKAARIKRFVTLIMTEMQEKGEVEDADEKADILDEYLTDLKSTVEEIPNNVTTEGITDSVQTTLTELDKITVGKEGLEGLAPMVEEELNTDVTEVAKPVDSLSPEEMQNMRNDVSGLKSLMLEIRGLLDEEVNAPVVHGWLEGM